MQSDSPELRTSDGLFSWPQTAFARSLSVRFLHLSSLLSETVSCDRDHGQMSFSLNFHEMGSPTEVSLPRSGAGAVSWLAAIALSGFVFGGRIQHGRGIIRTCKHDLGSGRLCSHSGHAIQRWRGALPFLELAAFRIRGEITTSILLFVPSHGLLGATCLRCGPRNCNS
jgi:hypothetical protein